MPFMSALLLGAPACLSCPLSLEHTLAYSQVCLQALVEPLPATETPLKEAMVHWSPSDTVTGPIRLWPLLSLLVAKAE